MGRFVCNTVVLEPRWGNLVPPHAGLVKLFAANDAHYEHVLDEMRSLTPHFERIAKTFTAETAPEPGWVGGPINAIDTALLYYFVSSYKPKTYLEIGSGVTTCFTRRAVQDHALSTKIISIDPQPRSEIDSICDEVVRVAFEEADLSIFDSLEPGDIVFMDGSHRCFMNSDVTVFMLDVVPKLNKGVIVHIHDILLPLDYPSFFTDWYWSEQYVVAAYLLGARERIEMVMPSAYVSQTEQFQETLARPFVDLGGANEQWRYGGSLWFTHR